MATVLKMNNLLNDPYFLVNSDHPGMVRTNVSFNGGNLLGWSRSIKMALGAKLKLGFINGSYPKLPPDDQIHQRWVCCDYMVTCWILNLMTAEYSTDFIFAKSVEHLWKDITERFGHCNGLVIYQL